MEKRGSFLFALALFAFANHLSAQEVSNTSEPPSPLVNTSQEESNTAESAAESGVLAGTEGTDMASMAAGPGGAEGAANGTSSGHPVANPFNFQTDPITGRFTYSIPVIPAPGRQGAQPAMGLVYNSAGGNGLCGVGWNLDLGFIQRDTRRGVPVKWGSTNALTQYDDNLGFIVNFGGVTSRLVPTAPSSYSYGYEFRAEVDSTFLKFIYVTNSFGTGPSGISPYWEVIDKSGNSFLFGTSSGSRMENDKSGWNPVTPNTPNAGGGVFRWSLDRVIDNNGNYTLILYMKDGNQIYPNQIQYNSNINDASGTTAAKHWINFEWIGREDKSISFQPGYRVETRWLLSNIVVEARGELVRRYSLNYTNSPSTQRSLLSSVRIFGEDNTNSLPAQVFSYQEKPAEFYPAVPWNGVYAEINTGTDDEWYGPSGSSTADDVISELLDVDADGLPDRVMRKLSSPYNYYGVQRNTGSGFYPANGVFQWGPVDTQGGDVQWGSIRGVNSYATSNDLLDMNGDGYLDRVMRRYSSPYTNFVVQFGLGLPVSGGFSSATMWGPVTNESTSSNWRSIRYADNSGVNTAVDLMDMNGDGMPDRVSRRLNAPYDRFKVQLNTGSGFTQMMDWGMLSSQGQTAAGWNSINAVNTASDTYVTMMDLNGDGLPDRVMRRYTSPYTNFVVQFNNGAGFEAAEGNLFYLNTQGQTSATWGSPNGLDGDMDTVAGFADINGDGLPDRVMQRTATPFTNYLAQINTGAGFRTNLVSFGGLDHMANLPQSSNGWTAVRGIYGDNDTGNLLIDINGDGLVDRVTRDHTTPLTSWMVQFAKGPAPDLLSEARNGLGGVINVSYAPSTQYNNRDRDYVGDPWAAGAVSLLGFNVWTVSSISAQDGLGKNYTTSYDYKGGYFDSVNKEFRGFNQVSVTDPLGGKTMTFFHQSGGRDESAQGEWQDQSSIAKKGIPYRVEVYGTNGALYRMTLNKVEEKTLHSNGWTFPYVSQTIQMVYEGTGTYKATAQRVSYDTNTGNVLVSEECGEVTQIDIANHTFSDYTGDNVFTVTAYATGLTFGAGSLPGGGYLPARSAINKPARVTLSSTPDETGRLKQTRFFYEARGNLTNSQIWLSTFGYLNTGSTFYDTVGNPYSSTDAAGVTTITTYDTYRTFPVKSVSGTFTNEMLANMKSGGVMWTKDPNGLTATNLLDVFFRTVEIRVSTNAASGPTLWRNKTDYSLLGTGTNGLTTNYVRRRAYDPGDPVNGIESFTYADGLGRSIQTRAESETNGVFRVSDVFFDGRGNTAFGTLPYFSPGTNFTLNTSISRLGSYTDYDPMGRAIVATPAVLATFDASGRITSVADTYGDTGSPVGSVTTSFTEAGNHWARTVVDAEGKTSKSYMDGFGRTTQIVNVTSGGNIITQFKYDLAGNLTNVTDHSNNITRIVYDSVGRKTSMTEPNMGTWNYFYDAAGRLTNQVDALGQSVRFHFTDALGRLSKKEVYNASGNLTNVVLYGYDTNLTGSGYGAWKGALTSVKDTNGWVRSGFDARGRITRTTRYLNKTGTAYTGETTYNEADQPVDITYPGNTTVVLRNYYTNGILYSVRSVHGTGGSSETFYQLGALNEIGQPLDYKTHNGTVTTSYSFFGNSKRLQRMRVTKPGGGYHQDLSYKFDTVSNVKQITEGVYSGNGSGGLTNAIYDDLHRLTQYSNARGTFTNTYDALGNLRRLGESGTNLYQYTSLRPHAVTLVGSKAYVYDNNGNMIARGAQSLSYDAENRLTLVDSNGVLTAFGYAEDGGRVWKQTPTDLQVWIGGAYEEKGGRALCHVFAGGKRIATFEPAIGGPYFAGVWAPKTFWAKGTDLLTSLTAWPFQEGRTPATVLITTLLAVLLLSITARRGWRWNPNAWMTHRFARLLSLFGSANHFARSSRGQETLIYSGEAKESPYVDCYELTKREQRHFFQPLWRQALSVVMMVMLIFTTTATNVQAQSYTPVFYYYHGDHLGSSSVMTDRNGVLVQHYEYAAFGNERFKDNASAVAMSHRYTGQVLDEETGLYYYNARYYDPELGRFTQPDTIVPDPGDGQTLNRYAYVNNNPLKYVDPSGHELATAIVIGVIVGAAIGGATAAATGGDVGMGIFLGAMGGLLGGVGAWAGGVLGASVSGAATPALAAASTAAAVGTCAGAMAGGAAGGAIGAAMTGGNVGMGALTGAISGAIGFGVGKIGFQNPGTFGEHLTNAGLSAAGGAAGGAAGAAVQGGDPGLGATYGAAGAFGGYLMSTALTPREIMDSKSGGSNGFRYKIKDSTGEEYDHIVTNKEGMLRFRSDLAKIRSNNAKIRQIDIYGHGLCSDTEIGGVLHFNVDRPYGALGEATGTMSLGDLQNHFSGLISRHATIRLQFCFSGESPKIYGGFAKLAPTASIMGVRGVRWGIGHYGPLWNQQAYFETNPNAYWR